MADQEETVALNLDESALFKESMAPDPVPAKTPEPEVKAPEPEGQPRDDKGRFAAKAEPETPAEPPQQPQTTEPPQDDRQGQVPAFRLKEVREERDAANKRAEEASRQNAVFQHQLQEMQRQIASINAPKPPDPVDFFQNPDEAFKQRLDPFEQRFNHIERQTLLNSSKALAYARHGVAAVDEMEKALETALAAGDPEVRQLGMQMQQSADPVGLAMQWHKRANLMAKIPDGNVDAYVNAEVEKKLKDPEFLKKAIEAARLQAGQQPNARPSVQLPQSLSKAGTGASEAPDADADMSDRGLFKHAMGGTRR